MHWYRFCVDLFETIPEARFSPLHFKYLDQLPHYANLSANWPGPFFRSCIFIYRALRDADFSVQFRSQCLQDTEVLIFANSKNQMAAVEKIEWSLSCNGKNTTIAGFLPQPNRNVTDSAYSKILISLADVSKAVILLMRRYRRLKKALGGAQDPRCRSFFDVFLSAYLYAPVFLKYLTSLRPKLVLVANDHNTCNRALIAVANQLGIKTAYVQHAHVTGLFPPLAVDYAFLDGKLAASVYYGTEKENSDLSAFSGASHVFLTGALKGIPERSSSRQVLTRRYRRVGIAVNLLTDSSILSALCGVLLSHNFTIVLRPHPGMNQDTVDQLVATLDLNSMSGSAASLDKAGVKQFFDSIDVLIAGNSSIVLEGALTGLPVIQYFSMDLIKSDYYNFSRNGIARSAADPQDVLHNIEKLGSNWRPLRKSVLHAYSSTYGTDSQGKECEVVATNIESLIAGESPNELFGYETTIVRK